MFNPNSNIPEEINQANEDLLYVLWSRHKILYAYHQSRISVANIQKHHTEIEQQINKFSEIAASNDRLQKFKELLIKLPQKSLEYSQLLRELSDHTNTIKANEINYLSEIEKVERLPNSDAKILRPFSKKINQFKQQIETDLSFLSPTKKIFEELLNNIRGIVAIDQIESDSNFEKQLREQDEKNAERDKKNERLIAFFCTALTVSGISAGAISEPTKTLVQNLSINLPLFIQNNGLLNFMLSGFFDIGFHIFVGIIVAIPVFYWVKHKK